VSEFKNQDADSSEDNIKRTSLTSFATIDEFGNKVYFGSKY
jgi:hypothetical protein